MSTLQENSVNSAGVEPTLNRRSRLMPKKPPGLPARSAITFRTGRRRTPGCGGLARPNRAASGCRSRIISPSCLGSVPRRGRTLKLYPVGPQPACRDFVKGLVLNSGNADWVAHDRLTGRRNRKHKRSRAA